MAIAGYGLDRIETSGAGSHSMLTGGRFELSGGILVSALQYKPLNDPFDPGNPLGDVFTWDGVQVERAPVVLTLQIGTDEEDGV